MCQGEVLAVEDSLDVVLIQPVRSPGTPGAPPESPLVTPTLILPDIFADLAVRVRAGNDNDNLSLTCLLYSLHLYW